MPRLHRPALLVADAEVPGVAKTYELCARIYVTVDAPDEGTARQWVGQYLEMSGPAGVSRGIDIDYIEVESISDGDDDEN